MKKENKFDMIFGLTKDDHVTDSPYNHHKYS